MNINIYDYDNRKTIINVQKEIFALVVIILSGDEIVTILFKDGTFETHDSCIDSFRYHNFYDGKYIVTKDNIEKWNKMEFENNGFQYSYLRRIAFEK